MKCESGAKGVMQFVPMRSSLYYPGIIKTRTLLLIDYHFSGSAASNGIEFPFHAVKTNRGRDCTYANRGRDHARVPRALHAPGVPSAGDIASMVADCTHSSAASARIWERIQDKHRLVGHTHTRGGQGNEAH
jgi:hypothetical protein